MVPYSAVVVWELRGVIEDVHCYFMQRQGGYVLSIERAGERLLEELHGDFREMMARAAELRTSLVRVGFEPVAAGEAGTTPSDSLLLNFVRVGTAPLTAAWSRPC